VAADGVLYAVLVPSTIPKGAVSAIDTATAKRWPGVVEIFTHLNTPRFGAVRSAPMGENNLPLQDNQIAFEGQPIALVVADSLENATEAARRLRVDYRREPYETDFRARLDRGEPLNIRLGPVDAQTGDPAAGFRSSARQVDNVYWTSDRHHHPMEPSATLAIWSDGQLVVHDAAQGVGIVRTALAEALGLDLANVRVRTEFVGGGFGCKGYVWPRTVLAAMASRAIGRPVKLVPRPSPAMAIRRQAGRRSRSPPRRMGRSRPFGITASTPALSPESSTNPRPWGRG
jgi:xanthine dehydrogenase YagR molybdenum-binding subunit